MGPHSEISQRFCGGGDKKKRELLKWKGLSGQKKGEVLLSRTSRPRERGGEGKKKIRRIGEGQGRGYFYFEQGEEKKNLNQNTIEKTTGTGQELRMRNWERVCHWGPQKRGNQKIQRGGKRAQFPVRKKEGRCWTVKGRGKGKMDQGGGGTSWTSTKRGRGGVTYHGGKGRGGVVQPDWGEASQSILSKL